MTSADTRGVTTIAEPLARRYALVLFLLCWLFGSVVVVSVAVDNRVTVRLWVAAGVIIAAALIGGCFRGWRIGLRIDTNGVTIRNFFRTQRIGWREVCRFADGSVVVLEQNYYAVWALRVVLRDERQTAAGGLTGHRSVMAEGGPRGGRWRGSSRVLRPSPPSSGAQNATGYRQN